MVFTFPQNLMSDSLEEQLDELEALKSVYEGRVRCHHTTGTVRGSITVELEPFSTPSLLHATVNGVRSSISVKILSPVILNFELPRDYPSTSSPKLDIECQWMHEDMVDAIQKVLFTTCSENQGMAVLFFCCQTIVDFIAEHEAELLDISVDCSSYGSKHKLSGAEILQQINESSEKTVELVFNSSCFDCEVCLENKIGRNCVKFTPCGHIFCKECVSGYFTSQLQDLQIKALECLTGSCESIPSHTVVREAVGELEFERYERILLERALGQMDDVVMCARQSCQKPVVLSNMNPTLGSCEYCGYSFCIVCKRAYHALEECKFKSADRVALIQKWEDSNEEERVEMGRRFGGMRQLQRVIDTVRNEGWIEGNSRPCPKCKTNIEKNEGCNKMHCTKCDSSFCWLCSTVLDPNNPYSHFNGEGEANCFNRLFEGVEEEDREDVDGVEERQNMLIMRLPDDHPYNQLNDRWDMYEDDITFEDDESSASEADLQL